ncbi:MAG: hypothetical protein RJA25_988, partial [Bacteroidota bacterium]
EIKVTPDKDVPTIPYATIYQGEDLPPIKKSLLVAPLEVYQAMINKNIK